MIGPAGFSGVWNSPRVCSAIARYQRSVSSRYARIVRAMRDRKRLQPVGEPAVAGFAVRPRPDPQHHLQADGVCQLDEAPHVAVPVPPHLALHVFVNVPEHVRGEHADPAGLHLAQLPRPAIGHVAAEVVFAHHGDPRAAVRRHEPARELNALRGIVGITHLERRSGDGRGRAHSDGVRGGCGLLRLCTAGRKAHAPNLPAHSNITTPQRSRHAIL